MVDNNECYVISVGDYLIPVYLRTAHEINEIRLKDQVVPGKDQDLLGMYDVKQRCIYVDKHMHIDEIEKTLIHEAMHALTNIIGSVLFTAGDISINELLSEYVSSFSKEIKVIFDDISKIITNLKEID